MIAKFRCEKTACGYDFSVVKSGLQKYIRRGIEDKALKCVEEIDRFAELGSEGERLRTNMLHRLQIIFLEDIGLGNYYLWPKMCEWIYQLFDERTKDNRDRQKEVNLLELMVRNLCRSKKTRGGSFMNALCNLNEEDILSLQHSGYAESLEVLDSFEKYLNKLSQLLPVKNWKCILYVRKLFDLCMEDKKRFKQLEALLETYVSMNECKIWKKDILNLKEGFLLYLIPLGKYLFGCEELQLDEDCVLFKGIWPCLAGFEMDDYVLDKHVKYKECKNKNIEYFAKESSKVIPEVFILPKEMNNIYLWLRCGKNKDELNELFDLKLKKVKQTVELVTLSDIILETDLEFVTRIQLVTSNSKTDTYYARFAGELMFVKGPFINDKIITDFIQFQEEKKALNMHYIKDIYCIYLYPNRWLEETPLGIRNSLDRTNKYPFMVSKSLFEISDIVTKVHSSLKWGPTEVVDTKKCIDIDVYKLSETQYMDYLTAIAFRISKNIGDLADRNFMLKDGNIYSIDEEYTKKKIDLLASLGKQKYEFIKSKYNQYNDKFPEWVKTILDLNFV